MSNLHKDSRRWIQLTLQVGLACGELLGSSDSHTDRVTQHHRIQQQISVATSTMAEVSARSRTLARLPVAHLVSGQLKVEAEDDARSLNTTRGADVVTEPRGEEQHLALYK